MASTIIPNRPLEVGIFATVDEAARAILMLLDVDFSQSEITVVCSDETKERFFRQYERQKPAGTLSPKAAIAGGAVGALLGGFTIVATAIATGSLALWAAGPIVAYTGGVAGGLVGAMMSRGVEKELANFYQQAVLDGAILVAVEHKGPDSESRLAEAAEVLASAGAKPLPLEEG
jgi:hypothetical protein